MEIMPFIAQPEKMTSRTDAQLYTIARVSGGVDTGQEMEWMSDIYYRISWDSRILKRRE
jgi:hypothetical protein